MWQEVERSQLLKKVEVQQDKEIKEHLRGKVVVRHMVQSLRT
jgi:hypothetical protein